MKIQKHLPIGNDQKKIKVENLLALTFRYRRYKLLMYQHFQKIGQQIANMID